MGFGANLWLMNAKAPLNTIHAADTQRLALTLKASGDALRLEILALLARDSFGVTELCQIFSTKQSGMSHHLKVLSNAGLVTTRREGNTIFYRRSEGPSSCTETQLRNAIYTAANAMEIHAEAQTQLNAVYEARSAASRAFFIDNASAFREQQDLIASYEFYGPEVAKVLDASAYPENGLALEVGPGAGEFLPELAKRFRRVIALDSAKAMLEHSQAQVEKLGLNNIRFEHNDTQYCRAYPAHVDCAIINMVLHHCSSPQLIFEDIAHALKKGGVLVISDLNAHDQDWVRETCGDHWLGFNTSDLLSWANNVALELGMSRYFALRNGFQIQIHQFVKH